MNVAGALARSMTSEGTLDVALVQRLLVEATSTQPALATAGEQESDGGQAGIFAASGLSVADVAARLMDSRFLELAQPFPLSEFIFSGGAGIPRLTEDEVDEFLSDVPERGPGYRSSWLELAPIEDDSRSWVAYPQSTSTSIEFHVILPVAQGGPYIRFLALDPGVPITTATTRPPQVVKRSGCDPGVTGLGETLREACLSADCSGLCEESWQLQRGRARLTGCDC